MVAVIVPQMQDLVGKIVTIWFNHTSGAAVNTLTIPNHLPDFDLKSNCPVISAASILTEAITDISESKVFEPAYNVGRAVAPDATDNEWAVQTAKTIKLDTSDKNGIVMLTYKAAGGRKY